MESTKLKVITVTSVLTGLSLAGITLPGIAYAERTQEADSIAEAFGEKSFHNLELRLRHERAKDRTALPLEGFAASPTVGVAGGPAGPLRWSQLTSLRTQLTYGTGSVCGTSAQTTMTNVSAYFRSTKYNPSVGNITNRAAYTVINEPSGTAMNEFWVQNDSIPDTNVRVGDQFITLDNSRFFGKYNYHQNPQSYRAATITNSSLMDTTIIYGYVSDILNNMTTTRQSQRRVRENTNLLNINWHGVDWGSVSVYDYMMKDKDAIAMRSQLNTVGFVNYEHFSANTYGIRFAGDTDVNCRDVSVNYELEYARQKGRYNNPVRYSARYWVAGVGASLEGFSAGLRYEVLGGQNRVNDKQFKTLGDKHEFLGNAGVFTLTPQAGIKDGMLRLGYSYDEQWHFRIDGHTFKAQSGSNKYGRELDLCARYDINKNYNVGLAYAKFKAKSGNTASAIGTALGDMTRYWLTLGANF